MNDKKILGPNLRKKMSRVKKFYLRNRGTVCHYLGHRCRPLGWGLRTLPLVSQAFVQPSARMLPPPPPPSRSSSKKPSLSLSFWRRLDIGFGPSDCHPALRPASGLPTCFWPSVQIFDHEKCRRRPQKIPSRKDLKNAAEIKGIENKPDPLFIIAITSH